MDNKELTYGQRAVGLTFNPSGDPMVEVMKGATAFLIDVLDKERNRGNGEKARLCAVAITQMQTAQMWAVKALTWEE